MIQILAPAKINLGLEILGKRSDAYHEIRTIFCTVSLFDRVQVTATAKANFQVNGPEIVGENLAEMAIRMAHASHASLPPAGFIIDKRIPLAAGLGGASSDAAAALLGLNRISPQMFTPGESDADSASMRQRRALPARRRACARPRTWGPPRTAPVPARCLRS